jgi:hypothetical protein
MMFPDYQRPLDQIRAGRLKAILSRDTRAGE